MAGYKWIFLCSPPMYGGLCIARIREADRGITNDAMHSQMHPSQNIDLRIDIVAGRKYHVWKPNENLAPRASNTQADFLCMFHATRRMHRRSRTDYSLPARMVVNRHPSNAINPCDPANLVICKFKMDYATSRARR